MNNKTMVAAVTGASGFIGKHLVMFLKENGFQVRALIHQKPFEIECEQFSGSLFDIDVLNRFLAGVDILFHLAAAMGSSGFNKKGFLHVNREGTRNVLQAAQKNGVKRIIHFSSAGVYGRTSGRVPLSETAELNPIDNYELSKKGSEDVALDFGQKLNISIVRPGWVYGEGDTRTFKLIRQINSGLFFIVGSGKVMHSPIYIQDLLKAVLSITREPFAGEIFNIGGEPMSVEDMVKIISQVLHRRIFPVKVPVFFVLPPVFLVEKICSLFNREGPITMAKLAFFRRGKPLSCQKIRHMAGVFFKTGFSTGIKKVID